MMGNDAQTPAGMRSRCRSPAGLQRASMTTTAILDGDHYVVNGSKTFITNGINADLVITGGQDRPVRSATRACRSLVIERGMGGFERGRNLDKVGLHSQDTAELFFTDVQVPVANRLGETRAAGFLPAASGTWPQERPVDRRHRVPPPPGPRFDVDARVRQGAPGVRPAHRLVPEQPVPARRRWRPRSTIAQSFIDRCVLGAQRRGRSPPRRRRWRSGGAPSSGPGGRHLRPAPRRLRLHDRVPDRPRLRRRPHHPIYGGTTEIMKEIIGAVARGRRGLDAGASGS